jgi:hypothetical protein
MSMWWCGSVTFVVCALVLCGEICWTHCIRFSEINARWNSEKCKRGIWACGEVEIFLQYPRFESILGWSQYALWTIIQAATPGRKAAKFTLNAFSYLLFRALKIRFLTFWAPTNAPYLSTDKCVIHFSSLIFCSFSSCGTTILAGN